MAGGNDRGFLYPRLLRDVPADLATVIILVILTNIAVLGPGVSETPLRVLFGLPLVLFLPGYALVAALFPEPGVTPSNSEPEAPPDAHGVRERGIDGIERVALSFGLSIAIVPLIGLVLNFTPWGIRLVPILVSVSGFTLIATLVAAGRRWQLPEEERFAVPYREWLGAMREVVFKPDSRTDAALNILLAVSVILAVASVGYAVTVPKDGERFTEFYLLTENDTGNLVADNYPTEFTQGKGRPIIIGVGNQEHRPANYTVVVALQRVEIQNNSSMTLAVQELDRFSVTTDHNESRLTNYTIVPTMAGDELRLAFLLYVDAPPRDPTVENAYRELHLWVNVTTPQ